MRSKFWYFFNPVILALASVAYGSLLIINRNVALQVDLFEAMQDAIVGCWLVFNGILKLVAVFISPRWVRKWALIGIMIGWAVISWAYMFSDVVNSGYVMAITLTILCGSELYRGDFDG